jgi:hypothetical protein
MRRTTLSFHTRLSFTTRSSSPSRRASSLLRASAGAPRSSSFYGLRGRAARPALASALVMASIWRLLRAPRPRVRGRARRPTRGVAPASAPRRRSGLMHRGVDPVGLSKLARGLGEIPELPGVDDGHRHPGESEGRSGGLLEPPGGLEYRQSATFSLRADGAPPSRDAPLVVGGLHVFPARPEHHVQAVLGSRSMPACRWVFPSSGCSPLLVALPCQCGLAGFGGVPGNCSGSLSAVRGATTLANQRSLSGAWTMGQSVCRALTADSTATRNIQGA